jgi:membrane peptidoglycan carboxypeptidase
MTTARWPTSRCKAPIRRGRPSRWSPRWPRWRRASSTRANRYYCPGALLDVGGRKFHCWSRGGHGSVSAVESLMKACDVYYYELAQKVGIDRIAEMARKLGLGVRT